MDPQQNQVPAPIQPITNPIPAPTPVPPQPQQPQKKSALKIVVTLIILIVIALVYFYIKGGKAPAQESSTITAPTTSAVTTLDDSDLIVAPLPDVATSSNAVIAFQSLKPLKAEDSKALSGYLASSTTILPPLAASQKLLAAYPEYLKVFDQNVNKTFYCKDGACSLTPIRSATALATLRSLVYFEQGKYPEATKSAIDVVTIGKNLTASNDDLITILVGWVVQKYGYTTLDLIAKKDPVVHLIDEEKQSLITTLRNEHKNVLKYEYTLGISNVNYINSPDKKPLYGLDENEQSSVDAYRKAIAENPSALNYQETKKYFYDTTKNMIAHVDLPCGTEIPNSLVATGYSEQNTTDENYIGKTLYSIGGVSLDNMNAKRCEIESAIQAL